MFNELIEQFKAAQVAAADAYHAVSRAERLLFPNVESYLHATKTRSSYKTERELSSFCRDLAAAIVRRACRNFAPPGGSLSIAREDELEECGIDLHEALEKGEVPDLDALWRHLERKFSGEGGATLAYEQAARSIIDGFYLKPSSEMKRTSSGVVIDMSAQSEECWNRKGQRTLSVYARDRVSACFRGLATVARKASFDELASQLADGRFLGEEYSSRAKLSFSGLDVTRFNDKWQCRFSFAVGDALSLFISEFGAAYLSTRG
ncbi:hypothetical protein [Paraburkholderia tropica]|uniref:DUF4942 domain-containing protein n=1 Tax=Paraburkholderia tropica TaxID=92647 RepID=A0AAQ1JXP5_9BURK|nr:hypothetical protein [Paraburkholderia tropica]RQN37239.1 hypothetical protein EHZ25_20020 [Paraburkholderia tropica]SEK13092.1 hypothetical protein SAMN05216550_12384 [Paraburkholderia tropica]